MLHADEPMFESVSDFFVFLAMLAGEILLVVALTAPAIWLWRRLRPSLIRSAEERALARPFASSQSPREAPASGFFPVACSSSLVCLLVSLGLFWQASEAREAARLGLPAADPGLAILLLSGLVHLAIVTMAVAVIGIHYFGTFSRKVKYDLILGSALLTWSSAGFLRSGMTIWGGPREPAAALQMAIGLLFWWAMFVAAQLWLGRFFRRVADGPRFRKWYFRFQSPVWWALSLVFVVLLLPYLLLRYHLIAVAARHPLLYFRSFDLREGPMAFANIVARASRRYGILQSLITSKQRGSDLQGRLDLTEQARFEAADEHSWRLWVSEALNRACAVMIDLTDSTENVLWETSQAVATLGPERVAVLYHGEQPWHPPGVWCLRYDLDERGVEAAEIELRRWLKKALV